MNRVDRTAVRQIILSWVGFDRPAVREQWPLKTTELTFVSERLLWNALPPFIHSH